MGGMGGTGSTTGEPYIVGLSKCKIMNCKGKVYEMFGFSWISAQQQHHLGSNVLPQSPLFIKAHLTNTDEFKYDWEKEIKKMHPLTSKRTHIKTKSPAHIKADVIYISKYT